MMSRMVVAIKYKHMIEFDVVEVPQKCDLKDKAVEVAIEKWGWSPTDMDSYGDKIEHFLIDSKLWKDVLSDIEWPTLDDFPEELGCHLDTASDAIKRCKLTVYLQCRMGWCERDTRAEGGRYIVPQYEKNYFDW